MTDQDTNPPCERCGGKGYIEVENWHECEIWACPACNPPYRELS